jgi:branched-chain amino acid transport system ATP-binding protein
MDRKQSVDSRATSTDVSNVLHVNNLSAAYGAVGALEQVSLSVRDGERIAIIGANGAGKSTLLNAIAGLLPETGGTIQEAITRPSRAASSSAPEAWRRL